MSKTWGGFHHRDILNNDFNSDHGRQIANAIAKHLPAEIMEHAKANGSPVIIINNLHVTVNSAHGGGATVNVTCRGCK